MSFFVDAFALFVYCSHAGAIRWIISTLRETWLTDLDVEAKARLSPTGRPRARAHQLYILIAEAHKQSPLVGGQVSLVEFPRQSRDAEIGWRSSTPMMGDATTQVMCVFVLATAEFCLLDSIPERTAHDIGKLKPSKLGGLRRTY